MTTNNDFIFELLKENTATFAAHLRPAAEADPSVTELIASAYSSFRAVPPEERSRAAATLVSVVAEAAFQAQPKASSGAWNWDRLEELAVDALSRVGGACNDLERAARQAYTSLFVAGMTIIGVSYFDSQNICVESKPHYLSDEFMQEWARTRFHSDNPGST